jgi:hypothetical protein
MVKMIDTANASSHKELFDKYSHIISILNGIPNLSAKTLGFDSNRNLNIQINSKNPKREIRVLCKSTAPGYPKDVRIAILEIKSEMPENGYGMIYLEHISEKSKEICLKANVGFADESGNMYFSCDGIYIDVSGRTHGKPVKRMVESVFFPKSTRILRLMLSNPKKEWSLTEIGNATNVSKAAVFKVTNRLIEQEIVTKRKVGINTRIKLQEPEELLRKWTQSYTYKKNKAVSYFSREDTETIEKQVFEFCKGKGTPFALTMTSALAKIQPGIRYKMNFLYLEGPHEALVEKLNLQIANEGANVLIMQPKDEGVFYEIQDIGGYPIVSDVQLYLDLIHYPIQGKENAEKILIQRIKPKWDEEDKKE